jgi:hypothetical protein
MLVLCAFAPLREVLVWSSASPRLRERDFGSARKMKQNGASFCRSRFLFPLEIPVWMTTSSAQNGCIMSRPSVFETLRRVANALSAKDLTQCAARVAGTKREKPRAPERFVARSGGAHIQNASPNSCANRRTYEQTPAASLRRGGYASTFRPTTTSTPASAAVCSGSNNQTLTPKPTRMVPSNVATPPTTIAYGNCVFTWAM